MKKRVLSLLLVLIMVLGMFPMSAMAAETDTVYISASHDGVYLDGMAYAAVPLSALEEIDLTDWGLGEGAEDNGSYDLRYDADGDGTYEITALHLAIYAHKYICEQSNTNILEPSQTSGPNGIFFGEIFGLEGDGNLRYDFNGAYPADETGWGLTADQIVLKDGDYIDFAHYSDWNFYSDSAYGFNYFADGSEGNWSVTHAYTATAGEELTVTLGRVVSDWMTNTSELVPVSSSSYIDAEGNYPPVYYGSAVGVPDADTAALNENGQATITFSEAGTYYVWANGGYGVDNAYGVPVSAPACAKVTVTAPACTHESWNAATCTTPKTCVACGVTEGEADPAAHNYLDGACKYCNAAEPVTTYTVTLPTETTGYTVSAAEGSVSPVTAGGSYSFTITIADGYEAGENFAVKANGTMLTAAVDVYTIENITTNQTITVDGVVERIEDTVIYTGSDWPFRDYYIESLTLSGAEVDYVDGFDVYLNHKTAQDSAFTLIAAAGGRRPNYLGVNWNDGDTNTKTYTTNLVNGEAIVKIYAYKASGAGASRSGTKTFYFHIAAPNARPTLVVGQDAAVNVTKTVGETFEVDLNTIFTDDDGNEMTYQVKLNDGSWTNLEGSEYHFTPESARNYALAFRAYDGFVYSKDTYTVNLTANNSSETYTVTVRAPEDVLFYCTDGFTSSVDVLGANIESEYKEGCYTLSVPENINRISWRMSDIGMSAVVEEDATLTLIEANFKVMAGGAEDAGALTVKYGDYAAVGSENSYLLLAGEQYSYVVIPANALYSTYNESGKTPIAGENVIELTLKHITVIAPAGSTVSSGRFYSYFRYDFNEAQKITELEDGRLSVDFPVPGYESFIRVQHPDGVTYWDFSGSGFSDGTTLEVTADMLFIGNTEYTKDTVYANFEKNSKDKADLYLTVNAQGWLDMDTGDTHSLNVFRNWIPVANSISNNGVSLPDVTYTVVDVNGNPSDVVTVTPDANNSCYADITAAKAGTAIILVSYDAVYNADGEGGKQFSAIWPENTGVIVVTVDAEDADIQTNITVNETANAGGKQILDVEHDILFYVGNAGAEYSFKPEDGCTVTISRSTVGSEMTFNGFTNEGVTVAADGTVTLSGLTTGAHIVKVKKDGKTAYQVIRAREVSYKLTHSDGTEVTAGNPAQPGETITVQFSKLIDPLAKLSGVYNANFGFYYNGEDGAAVRTSGGTYGVYNFSSNSGAQRFTATVPAEWDSATYTLTDGGIKLGGFGSSFGAHRSTT